MGQPTLQDVLGKIEAIDTPEAYRELASWMQTNGSRFWPVSEYQQIHTAMREKRREMRSVADFNEGVEPERSRVFDMPASLIQNGEHPNRDNAKSG